MLRLAIAACSLFLAVESSKTALLIIDVQKCFLPGGRLAVADGDAVIPVINNIRSTYSNEIALTVITQDWHCDGHVSFASSHVGSNNYDVIWLTYNSTGHLCTDNTCSVAYNISQTLWPDHCVMNTAQADTSPDLTVRPSDVVVKKGYHCDVDSYSGFFDNGGFEKTELDDVLRNHSITDVVVTGLALDYCVYYTSKDAKKLGYKVYLVRDASRSVSPITEEVALEDLETIGVHLINSTELRSAFATSSATKLSSLLRFTPVLFDISPYLTLIVLAILTVLNMAI